MTALTAEEVQKLEAAAKKYKASREEKRKALDAVRNDMDNETFSKAVEAANAAMHKFELEAITLANLFVNLTEV